MQDPNYHGKDIEKRKIIPNQYPHGMVMNKGKERNARSKSTHGTAKVQDSEPLVRLRAHSIREVQVLSRYTLQPVTDCNCVAVKRGGEQQEVNDQSVG